jgi:hypothetical protein
VRLEREADFLFISKVRFRNINILGFAQPVIHWISRVNVAGA